MPETTETKDEAAKLAELIAEKVAAGLKPEQARTVALAQLAEDAAAKAKAEKEAKAAEAEAAKTAKKDAGKSK
jgi:siroheme synthase (precorrin-2 oxidase/ferrochelatase)